MTRARFQDLFTHLQNSGFWMTWVDVYNVGGKNFINHVWRPAKGDWRAHVLVDGKTHQANTDKANAEGHFATCVESSVSGGKILYSAIFVKLPAGPQIMRHGLTYDEHMQELASATKQGVSPVSIAVSSVKGARSYTVLYRPESIGAWEIKSRILEADYQAEFDKQKAAGRRPVYLGAYMHDGKPCISAVFASKKFADGSARHGLSAAEYQTAWQAATGAGKLTRAVTAIDGAKTSHRFAARWWG